MKHGQTHTRLYNIWKNMKQRCYNPNNPKYGSYGGKGIAVCNEWKNSFKAFSRWAQENGYEDPPKDCNWWFRSYLALTIDRIDECKGYEPSNCRWIPFQENRLHRKTNQASGRQSGSPERLAAQLKNCSGRQPRQQKKSRTAIRLNTA